MSALSVYVSTAQLVLQSETVCEQRLQDLQSLFSQLRQLMSCVVCSQLLSDPYAPQNGRCHHNVCRLCVRGRKSQRPACYNCKDYQDFKTYTENRQMRFLLLCYKSLCDHLIGTSLYVQLGKQKSNNAVVNSVAVLNTNGGTPPVLSTHDIILEGASYEDVLHSFNNDLPRATVPRLQVQTVTALATQIPPISTTAVAPLAPLANSIHIRPHSQTTPKAATPPISAASSSIASYSAAAAQVIKQEPISPPLPPACAATQMPTAVPNLHTPTVPTQTSSFSIKHLKHIVDHSSAASTSMTSIANASLPASTHSITYVGNNAPGIVVPIASSSMTTTAPLTIASAKLLNRQWARNSALGVTSSSATASKLSTSATGEVRHPPLTYKVSSLTSIASSTPPLSAASTSSSLSSSSNVAATSNSNSNTNTATTAVTTTATVTSQQIRNPPSIKTVSNGSAMYSVLYTGIGNKITIKRKTDGDDDAAQRQKTASTSATTPAVFRHAASGAKVNPKRRGCRCGNATPTPGKLTCCGQRCPCYVDSKSCIGCKCRGCRNPHRPDGGKVRPVIPELACYEIQMADENSSLSPSELPIGMSASTPQTVTTTTPAATSYAERNSPQVQHLEDYATNQQSAAQLIAPPLPSQPLPQLSSLTPSPSTSSSSTATLIPFRNLQQLVTTAPATTHSGNVSNSGNQLQHQLTQQQSNMLQLENLQRESVLIQNAEGKYQVVNVFTTALHNQHQNSNQISSGGFQRIHTLSQLQAAAVGAAGGGGATNTISVLPPSINCTTVAACNTTTTTYQQQHSVTSTHHHQHQHHHQLQRISGASNAAISLQLQQQLKQNNIITVHPIASHATTTTHQQQQQQHQQLSNAHHVTQTTIPFMSAPTSAAAASSSPATTITLSPIIVSSPNTFTSDMFSSDSSEEFVSINNAAAAAAANVMSSSSLSMLHSNSNSNTPNNGVTHIVSTTVPTAQPSPQFGAPSSMMDVIDSNDVRLLSYDGFANY